MKYTLTPEDRQLFEARLQRRIPPPDSQTFEDLVNELETSDPDTARELRDAVKVIGLPSALSVQQAKAKEEAKFTRFFKRLFFKETPDGEVQDKGKITRAALIAGGLVLTIGAFGAILKPADASALSIAALAGTAGDSPTATNPKAKGVVTKSTALDASTQDGTSANTTSNNKPNQNKTNPSKPNANKATANIAGKGTSRPTTSSASKTKSNNAKTSQAKTTPRTAPKTINYNVPTPQDQSETSTTSTSPQARASTNAGANDVGAYNERRNSTQNYSTPRNVQASRPTPRTTPNTTWSTQANSANRLQSSSTTGKPQTQTNTARHKPATSSKLHLRQPVNAKPNQSKLALASTVAAAQPTPALHTSSNGPRQTTQATGMVVQSNASARPTTSPTNSDTGGIQLGGTRNAASASQANTPQNNTPTSNLPNDAVSGFPGTAQAQQPPQPQANGLPGSANLPPLESVLPVTVGMRLEARLVISVVAVEQGSAPIVAVSEHPPCGKEQCPPVVWIGQALLGPDRRIWASFTQATMDGKSYSVTGQALERVELRPGLPAEISDEAPSLVSDLLRGSIGALSDYLGAQLGARTTTITPGGGSQTSNSVPALENFFLGRLAGLFSMPSDSKALVRVARIPIDTSFAVLYGIPLTIGR